jgi:ectoine hydroxylase-related dioxygenase (phytanoyl-CoA dioxygenase family)
MEVIGDLLSSAPVVINSLLFEHGSQQAPHFDTFYMPSRTANLMTASWIAIDPVTETNGPLVYYPGSHLIPPFRFSDGSLCPPSPEEMREVEAHIQDVIKKSGVRQEIFLARPGDVLIWHAQLLHGGLPIFNKLEKRTSLVTHYWTTTDLTDVSNLAVLGPKQLLLKRPHHHVIDPANPPPVDEVLQALNTPKAHREGVPPEFDARSYLLKNPDVLAARADPYTHYIRHGRSEGRVW